MSQPQDSGMVEPGAGSLAGWVGKREKQLLLLLLVTLAGPLRSRGG